MSTAPLRRASVADELASALRARVLDGEIGAGEPLRELDLSERYGVSRHTLRAALRLLAADGLVVIEPNRGARVARLDAGRLQGLYELRTALEIEAAHLALERNGGRLPDVRVAVERLAAVCRRARPSWRAVEEAHAEVHGAIVHSSRAPRIEAAYDALADEMRLFVLQLRPVWPLERMRTHHEELVEALEHDGPKALRGHLRDGIDAVLGAAGDETRLAPTTPERLCRRPHDLR